MSKAYKLYWFGNNAKTTVISEVLRNHPGPQRVDIFDYGCGNGGDWPQILIDNPHIALTGFEPFAPAANAARRRLQGLNAIILSDEQFEMLRGGADIIISFSVFEHVIRRAEFLSHARRILRPDGLFYLNYDDGHFRYVLNLSQPWTWLLALKSAALTCLSGVLARMGRPQHYQRRVAAQDADNLVSEAGFTIERCEYHNVSLIKELAKTIPSEKQQQFAMLWMHFEEALNTQFSIRMSSHYYEDDINLWRVAGSRTLTLRQRSDLA